MVPQNGKKRYVGKEAEHSKISIIFYNSSYPLKPNTTETPPRPFFRNYLFYRHLLPYAGVKG